MIFGIKIDFRCLSIFTIVCILFFCNISIGQTDSLGNKVAVQVGFDSIKFVNGSKQAAKIIEVSDKYVRYKNPHDTLGPTYTVSKRDVEGFVMNGGCIDIKQYGYVDCVKDPSFGNIPASEFTNVLVGIDVWQFFNKHLQFNADYIFKGRRSGISIVGNMGFSNPKDSLTYDRLETKILSSGFYRKSFLGIGYKIFPTIHKRFTYFLSFNVNYGKAYRIETIRLPSMYWSGGYYLFGNEYYKKSVFYEANYLGYSFNNGLICRITKNIFCQGELILGANHYIYNIKDEIKHTFFPKIAASLLFGFAF